MTKQEKETLLKRRVVKSNELIQRARFSLSVPAQRILWYLISCINPNDQEFRTEEFVISDFCSMCGMEASGGNYEILKGALSELLTESARIWITLENGVQTPLMWIERPEIDQKSGKLTLKLDKALRPYLLNLKANFTQLEFIFSVKFKSKYSFRLYELAKSYQYHDSNPFIKVFQLGELKELLGADCYNLYKDFKARVLNPAIREITTYTDKNLEMSEIKKGRKVVALEFTISTKSGADLEKLRESLGVRHYKKRAPEKHQPKNETPPQVQTSFETRDGQQVIAEMRAFYESLVRDGQRKTVENQNT